MINCGSAHINLFRFETIIQRKGLRFHPYTATSMYYLSWILLLLRLFEKSSWNIQKHPPGGVLCKSFLKIFSKLTEKQLSWSLKLKAWDPHFFLIRLRCFPVNFGNFLRSPFSESTSDDCFWNLLFTYAYYEGIRFIQLPLALLYGSQPLAPNKFSSWNVYPSRNFTSITFEGSFSKSNKVLENI